MTMAAGLEMRVPFLDRAVVPFGVSLPDRMKVRGRRGKWIVRRWAAERLPAAVLQRPKWGFRVPLAQWFRGHLKDMLHGYLRSSRGLCARYGDRGRVEELLAAHDSGAVDSNLQLWTLLAAEVWYQDVFLGRDSSRGTANVSPAAAVS